MGDSFDKRPGADHAGSDAEGNWEQAETAGSLGTVGSSGSRGSSGHSSRWGSKRPRGVSDCMTVSVSDPRVLRATGTSALLSGLGRHFRKGTGLATATFTEEDAARLWSESWQVDWIDNFVSHCWSDAGKAKAAAVLWYFNGAAAALASIAAGLLCVVLSLVGWLPTCLQEGHLPGQASGRFAPWSLCVGSLVFFGMFAFGHRITDSRLRHRIAASRTFFFDKLCVHQSDAEWKTAGIMSIAGIVGRSRCMLVLWSPQYFTRLWCTLECATLVHAAERDMRKRKQLPLTFYPIAIANNAIMLAIVAFVSQTFFQFSKLIALQYSLEATQTIMNAIMGMSLVVIIPVYMHSLRWYMRQRMLLNRQLEGFSISGAGCFLDSDRAMICDTIELWFGSLDAFDHAVRTKMRQHVLQAIGSEVHVSREIALGLVPFICSELDYLPMYIGVGGWHGVMLVLSIPSYILCFMAQIQLLHRTARCVARKRLPWAADAAVTFAVGLLWTCAALAQLVLLDLPYYIPVGFTAQFVIRASILVFYVTLTTLLALAN